MTFIRLDSGRYIGFKIMPVQDGIVRSGANNNLKFDIRKGNEIKMPGNGIYLSSDPSYVFDYYGELSNQEVFLVLSFDEKDIVTGKTQLINGDKEPEISLSCVKIEDYFKMDWENRSDDARALMVKYIDAAEQMRFNSVTSLSLEL